MQRVKRPAPTIHKEVTCVLRGYSMNSGFTQGPGVGYNIVKLEQVQTEAVADEIEVVTLPRPGAAPPIGSQVRIFIIVHDSS